MKHKQFWIVLGACFVLLVIYLSLTPQPLQIPKFHRFNVAHMSAYAWLMFWFSQIYRRPPQRVVLGIAFLALGIALEYIQAYVGRDFAYTDMRDDGIGIVIGALLVLTPLGSSLGRIEGWLRA